MKNAQIIIVSGMSGAGKSSVIGVLEDIGFICIDNLPMAMLDSLVDWLDQNDDERYCRLALSTTTFNFQQTRAKLANTPYAIKAVYLDAQDDILVNRYQFTRRKHPFIVDGTCTTLQQAIALERSYFHQILDDVLMIDTSNFSNDKLRVVIEQQFSSELDNRFAISFISFGYRHGLPLDADLILDERMLINPYWDETLRFLTGNDQEIMEYVLSNELTQRMFAKLIPYLDLVFESFSSSKKNFITVAIGCTGGKHRSVSVVNYLFNYYEQKYRVMKIHRDVKRKPQE